MVRVLLIGVGLQVLSVSPLLAQQSQGWKVRGDTAGAPPGCGASAGIAAISTWFAAFHTADSASLARATAIRHFVFSTGKFTPSDSFVRVDSLPALLRYARARARRHERMTIEAVRFYGWRGRDLGFMPYFVRVADDLGQQPLAGIGKAGYSCGQGLSVINLAPRPPNDPGPRN